MDRVQTKTSPPVFIGLFHLYSTRSSTLNFSKPKLELTNTKDCLTSTEKLLFSKLK